MRAPQCDHTEQLLLFARPSSECSDGVFSHSAEDGDKQPQFIGILGTICSYSYAMPSAVPLYVVQLAHAGIMLVDRLRCWPNTYPLYILPFVRFGRRCRSTACDWSRWPSRPITCLLSESVALRISAMVGLGMCNRSHGPSTWIESILWWMCDILL